MGQDQVGHGQRYKVHFLMFSISLFILHGHATAVFSFMTQLFPSFRQRDYCPRLRARFAARCTYMIAEHAEGSAISFRTAAFGLRSKSRGVVGLRETGSGGVNETVRSEMWQVWDHTWTQAVRATANLACDIA